MKKIIIVMSLLLGSVCTIFLLTYFGILFRAQSPQPASPETISDLIQDSTKQATQQNVNWKVEEVVQGLQVPWSMAFTSPSRMLVTERAGRVRVIQDGKLQEQPLHTFSVIKSKSEEGLMGMAVDPEYEKNSFVYFCYAVPKDKEFEDHVVRMKDLGNSLTEETILLEGIPAATNHAGCRIKFGPDGKLYVTTGDATNKQLAQNLHSLGGKILRINSDGSIPDDNPTSGSPIWSFGHRNPQGIDWHPVTHTLIETEHGPTIFDGPAGGDEVNLIEKGHNYGWPLVSHTKHTDGLNDPLLVFTPAVAPAAGMFYGSDTFPQWKNNFFFAMLKGEGIMRVLFDAEGKKPLQFERLEEIKFGRIRELITGPDGNIYFATSNQDGRGSPKTGDDKIYRIIPQ